MIANNTITVTQEQALAKYQLYEKFDEITYNKKGDATATKHVKYGTPYDLIVKVNSKGKILKEQSRLWL